MGLNLSRVYLDTCLVIYFVESHVRFDPVITEAIQKATDSLFFISPLVELEALIVPLRENNLLLVQRYEMFFNQYARLDIPSVVYRQAAELRARHSLKTPDALHLATALYHGCSKFWTNDNRLQRVISNYAVNICTDVI